MSLAAELPHGLTSLNLILSDAVDLRYTRVGEDDLESLAAIYSSVPGRRAAAWPGQFAVGVHREELCTRSRTLGRAAREPSP